MSQIAVADPEKEIQEQRQENLESPAGSNSTG
jgi:hypothetical protein